METLSNLESFARAAECGSFTAAARRPGVTPAAVSRNVSVLEKNLGVRLFERSTRKLALTERGMAFLASIGTSLDTLQAAIDSASGGTAEPSGVLKVSVSPVFGLAHVLPLMPELLRRHPALRPEWHFENRQVDLVAEGYDAAIGGGVGLSPAVVFKKLAPAHLVAVASPRYLRGRPGPVSPAGLVELDGIVLRSSRSGRIHRWVMRDARGRTEAATTTERIVVNEPAALCAAARLDLGVAVVALPDVLGDLESGALVRVLPRWYASAGDFCVYHAGGKLLPAKTRAFVDYLVESFRRLDLARRFTASTHE